MDPVSANPPSYPINKALSAYAKTPRADKPGGTPYASNISPVRRTAAPSEPSSTNPSRATDPVARISPSPMTQRAGAIGQLVGAKVGPIDLSSDVAQVNAPKPTVTSAGTYTLYPQHADRVQAATGLAANTPNTGRSLDIRG